MGNTMTIPGLTVVSTPVAPGISPLTYGVGLSGLALLQEFPAYQRVDWNFFANSRNVIGPSGPLAEALKDAGINSSGTAYQQLELELSTPKPRSMQWLSPPKN